jgi:hypothetical protein
MDSVNETFGLYKESKVSTPIKGRKIILDDSVDDLKVEPKIHDILADILSGGFSSTRGSKSSKLRNTFNLKSSKSEDRKEP